MKFIIFITVMAISAASYSGSSKEAEISSLVAQYHSKFFIHTLPGESACYDLACEALSGQECNEDHPRPSLRQACRGNLNNSCIAFALEKVTRFDLNELHEMITLAKSCRGLYNQGCLRYTCENISYFHCDNLIDITSINKACSKIQ